ncbi:hypothetical protein T492DRAFT_975168 [Pavlovales sp. CCMP2436]|nr:hypothetical protein T492DRAFT_975168 [Pavlovales sp. CCMP2436]
MSADRQCGLAASGGWVSKPPIDGLVDSACRSSAHEPAAHTSFGDSARRSHGRVTGARGGPQPFARWSGAALGLLALAAQTNGSRPVWVVPPSSAVAQVCIGSAENTSSAPALSSRSGVRGRAAACVARGDGQWVRRTTGDLPYRLRSDYLPNWNTSMHYWGQCDRTFDLAGESTPDRAARLLLSRTLRWVPAGDGCEALNEEPGGGLPTLDTLRSRFCAAFAGSLLLFIGDSVQGELFTSLAHILQWRTATAPQCMPATPRLMESAKDPEEVVVEVEVCGSAGAPVRLAPVRLRFVRNEFALLNSTASETNVYRRPWRKMCLWTHADASDADVVVLSRGPHFLPNAQFAAQLDTTLAALAALPQTPSGRRRRIVYRGTHAPVPGCDPRAKPSQTSLASRLASKRSGAFMWGEFAPQNEIARCLAAQHGAAYVDVYNMMSYRPDAALKRGDCLHSCLPGPIDEWSRLLLAFLVADAPSTTD